MVGRYANTDGNHMLKQDKEENICYELECLQAEATARH
jgi:hypothetical protein